MLVTAFWRLRDCLDFSTARVNLLSELAKAVDLRVFCYLGDFLAKRERSDSPLSPLLLDSSNPKSTQQCRHRRSLALIRLLGRDSCSCEQLAHPSNRSHLSRCLRSSAVS